MANPTPLPDAPGVLTPEQLKYFTEYYRRDGKHCDGNLMLAHITAREEQLRAVLTRMLKNGLNTPGPWRCKFDPITQEQPPAPQSERLKEMPSPTPLPDAPRRYILYDGRAADGNTVLCLEDTLKQARKSARDFGEAVIFSFIELPDIRDGRKNHYVITDEQFVEVVRATSKIQMRSSDMEVIDKGIKGK